MPTAVAIVRALVIAGWLLAGTSRAIVHDRFRVMETGAPLSPRYYNAAPASPLLRRQSQCLAGSHPCNEIGDAGSKSCCPDTSYCIVNPDNTKETKCCPIGSQCNSPCSPQQFQCEATVTITVGDATSTSLAAACCSRVCTRTSMFGCAASFGGGCCSYGSICATNQCISTVTPSTSTTPVVSIVPSGCTTSQITCPTNLGGGCCAVTQSCTLVSGAAHCAEISHTPTASGITPVEQDGGLGTGAKAGIGVGVVAASGLFIGALTWWCLRKRKERRNSVYPPPRPTGVIGAVVGGAGGSEMREDNSDVLSQPAAHGLTQDYFGPDPTIGPFSETPHNTSTGTTPSANRDRGGVPVHPDSPGDIAVPVEIDSRVREVRPHPQSPEPPVDDRAVSPIGYYYDPPQHSMGQTFELYGSDVSGPMMPNIPSIPTPYGVTPTPPTPQDQGSQHRPSDDGRRYYGS